jgi:hypothetical protein
VVDQSRRRPTVSPPGWRRVPRRAPKLARGAASSSAFAWLKRESVALLAVAGAALTVLAQLATIMPLAPQLAPVLTRWQELTHTLWRPPLDLAGIDVHPHIVAALNVAVFMALLGAGARISARLAGTPLAPISFGRFFDDQTWPSLIVFASLCLIFLLGRGDTEALTVMGSEEIGKYSFAGLVTLGYFAGDFIGHRAFHLRLYRLAVFVALLAAANLALVHLGGTPADVP